MQNKNLFVLIVMTCQEKKARRMRKAETLLLGEVFQTFDSFSQSLLSLAELPYSRSQTGGFFTVVEKACVFEQLILAPDHRDSHLLSFSLFRSLLNDRILRVVSLAW